MDNANYRSAVRGTAQRRFKDAQTVKSKIVPRYPQTAEREFMRLNKAYNAILNTTLKKYLPEIIDSYKTERKDSRFDDGFFFGKSLSEIMQKIAKEVEKSIAKFDLDKRVEKIANLANSQSVREWKRVVKKTLGINIFEDYYKSDMYSNALQQWVSKNVQAIKSIPNDTLGNLEKIITDGYRNGTSVTQLRKEIQENYNVNKRKAELLARGQISTLNSQLTKMQQTDAGVKYYEWSTSLDDRVRDCHAELHGKIFSWDDPPEMWYDTKNGRVYTGRYCNPGEDYCCRCVAKPIFDWQTVNVPANNKDS